MFCFVLLLLSRFDAILQRQSKHKDKEDFFLVKYTLIRKYSTLGSPGLWRTRGKRRKLTNISRHLYIPLYHCPPPPPPKKKKQKKENNNKKPKKQQQKNKQTTTTKNKNKNKKTNKQTKNNKKQQKTTTTTKPQHQQKTPLFCSNSFF